MKNTRTLLILLIIYSALFACSQGQRPTYRIGVSQCSQDDWRTKMNDEIRREGLLHDNLTIDIVSANDDSEKQIADVRRMAAQGYDLIMVSPNEADALTPVIAEVYKKGIPVIIFDRHINGETYTARVCADDAALGRAAAFYATHLNPPVRRALEITGLPGSTPAQGRHNGFTEAFIADGGTILASAPANWNQEDAERIADSLLSLYPDVDLIFAHNDRMAIGASNVAKAKGIRERIKIIGIDAAPQIGIQAVADGNIDATFLYPTEGHRLVRIALAILQGEDYPKIDILPTASAVDASNADILLLQNDALQDETEKMLSLQSRMKIFWAQYATQKALFYAAIVIIVLLIGVVFLVLRVYWQHKRHQAELEAATAAKLMFFTNVSHDLRTPLTLIAEPVAQIAKAPNLNPDQQTLMKLADKNVRILRRLINQILDFRKYENDKMGMTLTETALGHDVEEWMQSFYPAAHKRNLKLSFDRGEGSDAMLAVDVEKMERVFFNLLSNAFKYTPDGGTISVRYSATPTAATISVTDNGRGIAPEDLAKIFDRFYQVDRVHVNGSGIGLSLTKAFVELHGGTLSVTSAPGKGSTFTVELPVRHTDAKDEMARSSLDAGDVEAELNPIEIENTFDENKPRVLVIDDNTDILLLVGRLLGEQYNVLTATNGSEGIRKAAKYVPDLIICDVMMPGIDGLEVCRRLKAEVTTSHIPVLMLTACSMDEQRVEGYRSGADAYLPKPFSGDMLKTRCTNLLENRRRIADLWAHTDAPAPENTAKKALPRDKDIDSEFYDRFLTIFEAEMGNSELSVDTLAAKMGLERSQFYRKIKALTGLSPVELIRNLRLKKAQAMLRTTDKTISEIAYEIGFSTPAYFTRCYREAFDETPSDTRGKLGR